jgi:hypothetical protein
LATTSYVKAETVAPTSATGNCIVADVGASVPTSIAKRPIDYVRIIVDASMMIALALCPGAPTVVWDNDIAERFVSEASAVPSDAVVVGALSNETSVPNRVLSSLTPVLGVHPAPRRVGPTHWALSLPSADIDVVALIRGADTDTRLFRATTCIEALER